MVYRKDRKVNSKKIPKNGFVIIIGAMKCGTSSLYSYLVKHPSICPSIVKEPEYFSRNQAHGYKVDKYENLWDFDSNTHRYVLEASTGYTKYASEPNVPETIHKYGILPKFIYIVRDPFVRTLSHYNHVRYKYDIGSDWSILSDPIIDVSKYFLQLERFREYFPKENLLILDFDDLKTDLQAVLDKVYDFLSLAKIQISDDFLVHNKTNTLSKFQMFMKQKSFLRRPYLLIPQGIRDVGKKIFKNYSTLEELRKLTNEEKKIMHERLADDMKQFHKEYGFDVGKWGFNI